MTSSNVIPACPSLLKVTPAKPANITTHLTDMARRQPTRAAVICAHGRDAKGAVAYEQLTFDELEQASNRLAHGLSAIGIRRGVRAALMVPPGLDFFALTFALFKVGAVPVLIDPGIGMRNLRGCLAQARPEAFIAIPKAHAARVVLGWARDSIRIAVTAGAKWFWGGHTLRELHERTPAGLPYSAIEPAPDETAAILFTSGSTGAPKGAIYTHEVFGAQINHIRRLYGIEPGETDLATFPLFALFGPALGMTAVVPEMDASRPASADPATIIGAIEQFGITNMFGSPALVNRVGRYGEAHGIRLPTLRRAISAGAPVPAQVLERFTAMLNPGAQVYTPYGATECLPVASIGSDEILKETHRLTDAGAGVCIGRPVEGLTARIIRITDEPIATWNDALLLPDGEIGEIAVKAAHATRGYFDLPSATAMAKIQDPAGGGFYHRMGDVGYVDERGRLWFCGRKAHRVVTAQDTHYTIPCEAVFNSSPRVYRSALVGVQRHGDTEPVLCVELEAAACNDAHEDLRAELRGLGSKHAHTRDIQTILFHPAFPVDVRHNAKIFRDKLAVWAARQLR
ncbi:MAG: peptide synthase [Betaproteobacteria bacterium]|nr:peptide synthase [Betaproteobacteria bacterium]